jgi:ClpP class serine protease
MKTSYQRRIDEISELKVEIIELKRAVTEKAAILFNDRAWLGRSCERYGYVDSNGNTRITAVV